MILCYSGTGNSRYCADFLADHLDDTVQDLNTLLRAGTSPAFTSDRPFVLVTPTYSWQVPHLVADLLRRSRFSGSQDLYFVLTCGFDIGNAAVKNEALAKELGLHCRGTLEVVMPENYIALFDAPEEKAALRIIQKARPVLEQGAKTIADGKDLLPVRPVTCSDRIRSGLVNKVFYPLIVHDKKFTVSDACIHCGKCAEACPTQDIRLVDGKPVWGGNCTHCMACICGCPAQAIEYGKASVGKPRYQCPPYKKEDQA